MLSRSALLVSIIAVLIAFFFTLLDASLVLFAYDVLHNNPSNVQYAFSNKRIWLTGASSGIGAELARQLCHQTSAHIVLMARRREKLEQVAKDCPPSRGGSITILSLDATGNETEGTVGRVVNHLGGIDVLILNAGRFLEVPSLEVDTAQVRDIMELNLVSNIRLATEVIKRDNWTVKKSGHVVVTSSLAGRLGTPVSSSYAASKHALHGYFASLRAELPFLRIDIVCPGAVDTDIFDSSNRPDDKKSIPQTIPGALMSSQRTARLILSAMMGRPAFLFRETWIARGLSLFVTYLGQYTPHLYSIISVFMDPIIMSNYYKGEGFGFAFLGKLLRSDANDELF